MDRVYSNIAYNIHVAVDSILNINGVAVAVCAHT
jgi:hypothetical protein